MRKLIKLAIEALEESTLNEIELSDGKNRVRVVRLAPTIWYNTPGYYYNYQYPYPTRGKVE